MEGTKAGNMCEADRSAVLRARKLDGLSTSLGGESHGAGAALAILLTKGPHVLQKEESGYTTGCLWVVRS